MKTGYHLHAEGDDGDPRGLYDPAGLRRGRVELGKRIEPDFASLHRSARNMNERLGAAFQLGRAALTIAGGVVSQSALASSSVPFTVPMGVTLVEVARELTLSQPDILWVRPGDSEGRTLFSIGRRRARRFEVRRRLREGVSAVACRARIQGGRRLDADPARRGRAAMGVSRTTTLHVGAGTGARRSSGERRRVGKRGSKLAEHKLDTGTLLPPAGWQVAQFKPESTVTMPSGIDALDRGRGTGHRAHGLRRFYALCVRWQSEKDRRTCSANGCELDWVPLTAPDFAQGVGDFTIVTRSDGASQWAYRKQPLYRYRGDLLPGDAFGGNVNRKWKIAAITQSFRPARVERCGIEAYGNGLTLNGMTLYTGVPFQKRWGGRNTRDGFRNAWSRSVRLGTAACGSQKCLDEWQPFLAPANAQASGFWQIYARQDGARQWAYRGYALWTRATDKKPGDITGQLTYDYARVGGTESDLKRAAFLDDVGGDRVYGGAGIYWVLARP